MSSGRAAFMMKSAAQAHATIDFTRANARGAFLNTLLTTRWVGSFHTALCAGFSAGPAEICFAIASMHVIRCPTNARLAST
jgi:hypothetical protein